MFLYRKLFKLSCFFAFTLIISIILSLRFGASFISFKDIYAFFINRDYPLGSKEIIINLRLTRAIFSSLVGASLSISGTVLQTILANPLADPYILGISSGATLGLCILWIFFNHALMYLTPVAGFCGAILAIGLVLIISNYKSQIDSSRLILSGVIVNIFFSSCVILLLALSSDGLQNIFFWLMGDLSRASIIDVKILLFIVSLSIALFFFYSKQLNVLASGDESALSLGVNVIALRKILIILTSILVASSVSFSGPIGFVGLIIPHITRMITGNDHRILTISSGFIGAIFLIITDTISRSILTSEEIPIGVITSFIGVPFFVFLLLKKKN
jgi:iron complex transport system permease protein